MLTVNIAESKINYFQTIVTIEHNILEFDISMWNSEIFQVLDSCDELVK